MDVNVNRSQEYKCTLIKYEVDIKLNRYMESVNTFTPRTQDLEVDCFLLGQGYTDAETLILS